MLFAALHSNISLSSWSAWMSNRWWLRVRGLIWKECNSKLDFDLLLHTPRYFAQYAFFTCLFNILKHTQLDWCWANQNYWNHTAKKIQDFPKSISWSKTVFLTLTVGEAVQSAHFFRWLFLHEKRCLEVPHFESLSNFRNYS